MKAPVREFKAQLSHYLREARAGREVIVTSRGRAIARLLAVDEGEAPAGEELLRRLQGIRGIQLSAGGKPLGAARPIRHKQGQKTLAEVVIEGRR